MITIDDSAKPKVKDVPIKNVYGFAMNNGVCFIDSYDKHIISLWNTDSSMDVDDLSNFTLDSMLSEVVEGLSICNFEDIIKIFYNDEDYDLIVKY